MWTNPQGTADLVTFTKKPLIKSIIFWAVLKLIRFALRVMIVGSEKDTFFVKVIYKGKSLWEQSSAINL